MNLTEDKIKQIKVAAADLKKSADNLTYNPPSTTKVQLSPSWRYKKVILLLRAKTNVGAKVEKDFAELDRLHQEYERWRGKAITEDNEEEFMIMVDSLKGTLYDLADTFRQIAQIAREELVAEEPAETEQKTTPAKFRRLRAWLWKLYEKTLKVIIDAVLERMWRS